MTTKVTARSKKLAMYLQSELGWDIFQSLERNCTMCGQKAFFASDMYCGDCGAKLPKPKPDTQTYVDLEHALQHALGEKK